MNCRSERLCALFFLSGARALCAGKFCFGLLLSVLLCLKSQIEMLAGICFFWGGRIFM